MGEGNAYGRLGEHVKAHRLIQLFSRFETEFDMSSLHLTYKKAQANREVGMALWLAIRPTCKADDDGIYGYLTWNENSDSHFPLP